MKANENIPLKYLSHNELFTENFFQSPTSYSCSDPNELILNFLEIFTKYSLCFLLLIIFLLVL